METGCAGRYQDGVHLGGAWLWNMLTCFALLLRRVRSEDCDINAQDG